MLNERADSRTNCDRATLLASLYSSAARDCTCRLRTVSRSEELEAEDDENSPRRSIRHRFVAQVNTAGLLCGQSKRYQRIPAGFDKEYGEQDNYGECDAEGMRQQGSKDTRIYHRCLWIAELRGEAEEKGSWQRTSLRA